MAPFTGPAASVGQQQVRWANFYVKQYNKAHKTKIKLVNEDTQLGAAAGSAETLKGAKALASNSAVLGVVGPAGSQENEVSRKTLKSAGFAWVDGVRDCGQARRGQERHAGLLLPRRAAGLEAGLDGRHADRRQAEVEEHPHHRRPGDLQHRSRRCGAGQAEGRRQDRHA